MRCFQSQPPSALQLHWKTLWQAESVEVSKIQKKSKNPKYKLLGSQEDLGELAK